MTHFSRRVLGFPSTRWSEVARAASNSSSIKQEALERLLTQYLPVIRSYLRVRKKLNPDDADDLAQGFAANVLLEQDLLARANRLRGRFRSLLLTALDRYVVSDFRYRLARKRYPKTIVSLDDAPEPVATNISHRNTFEVQWSRRVIVQAIKSMRRQCRSVGRDHEWVIFKSQLLGPCYGRAKPRYKELVQSLDLESPVQAANLLVTSKRRFIRILQEIVQEYTIAPELVESEIRDLIRSLNRLTK